MHAFERFEVFFPAAEIQSAAAVGEIRRKLRVAAGEFYILVDLRDDADVFELFGGRKSDERAAAELFRHAGEHLRTLVIFSPIIQLLFDDGGVGVNVDERLEIFEIAAEQAVEAAVRVEKYIELVLVAAEEFIHLAAYRRAARAL